MPYLYAMAVKAHKIGVPVLRPMVLEFQNDPACSFLDLQYMLGDNLLVAPVFNDRGETETYLPLSNQTWTHWITNEQTSGGRYISGKYDYFSLPLWVRPNSIIAVGRENSTVEYDYENNPILHVFCLDKAETTIYGKDGKEHFTVQLEKIDLENKIVLNVTGETKGFTLLFRNLSEIHGENGLTCRETELGAEIDILAGCKSLEIFI